MASSGEMIRKSQSLHDLEKKTTTTAAKADDLKAVADKIDDFLQTVSQQQEALNKMLEERKMKRTNSLNRKTPSQTLSSMTSWRIQPEKSSLSRKKPVDLKVKAPLKNNGTKKSAPVIDASKVTSRLKTDRNYQPPRRPPQPRQSQPPLRPSTLEVEEDYGDDFEAEDEGEDDADEAAMMVKQKEAWLYEQAIRGRARQKAAKLRKQFYHEKESSKDSAYGFSGGENSRLHTREPTPDANNHVQPRIINSRLKAGPPPTLSKSRFNTLPSKNLSNRKSFDMKEYDSEKMEFLSRVTKEILSRGLYTEKAILRVVEGQMSLGESSLSAKEKAGLVQKLKSDLGLEKRLHPQLSSDSSSSPTRPKTCQNRLQKQQTLSSPDDSLRSLLRDESDQEIVEILKRTRKSQKSAAKLQPREAVKPHPALLSTSLDLSNLNVSFNSANIQEAKRKLEESRTQALLVKSFAYDKNETSEAEEDQDNESSSLYQSDKSAEVKYDNDFVEEDIETESASEIQDEDIP